MRLRDATVIPVLIRVVMHQAAGQVNSKVLGMTKDEFNGVSVEIFVGIRLKMYAVKYAVSDIIKRYRYYKKRYQKVCHQKRH